MEIAILALGSFWGSEKKFSELNGVIETEVGYCGGYNQNTNYEEVCRGKTNHAEVVKIEFDEIIISYKKILEFFFEIHDPTTLNSQGLDFGSQYRSEIFYNDDIQKNIAQEVKNNLNKNLNGKIVTNISNKKNYCKAEKYHQKYLDKKKF